MKGSGEKICTVTDAARAHTLSVDALARCGICGAKAHDPANVCDPVQLPEPGTFGD